MSQFSSRRSLPKKMHPTNDLIRYQKEMAYLEETKSLSNVIITPEQSLERFASQCWRETSCQSRFTRPLCKQSLSEDLDFKPRCCGVQFVQCARRNENFGRTTCGCFTMTSQLLTLPWAYIPWFLIFFFPTFSSSKHSSRGFVLKTWPTSKSLSRRTCGRCRNNPSRKTWMLTREGWESMLDFRRGDVTLKWKLKFIRRFQ